MGRLARLSEQFLAELTLTAIENPLSVCDSTLSLSHMNPIRPLFYFLALCLFSLSSAWASVLVWDRTEVRIDMEPDELEAKASYTVTNKGDETLRVARIKTSCGCTGSVIDRKILEPGQSTEIRATFNKGKRKGKNHSKLYVYLDSQADAVATLHFIINIPELVTAQPRVIYWNNRNAKSPRTIRVELNEDHVNELSSIKYDKSLLSVTKETVKDADAKHQFILTVAPQSYDTNLRATIELEASGPNKTKGSTKIHAFVQGGVTKE